MPAPRRLLYRLACLYVGLALFGLSIAMMVVAGLGLAPWDVLHQGLSRQAGLPLGWIVIGVSVAVMLAWFPLRQRPGLGTISNVVLVGLTIDAGLAVLPRPEAITSRCGFLLSGIVGNAVATALYIGADLGPGARDGLMTGLAARGHSIRLVRTCLELTVLAAGWLLGGTVGIGTVAYSLSIGPLVQFFLPRLASGRPTAGSAALHPRRFLPRYSTKFIRASSIAQRRHLVTELPDESRTAGSAPDADDGCAQLLGAALPSLRLESTTEHIDLAQLASELLVLFIYPHATGLPDAPVPGWDAIPGARGCTEQSCGFRDEHARFGDLGASLAGLSAQTVEEQREFTARMGVRFPLISDPALRLATALGLPTFTVAGRTFYKRMALVVRRGTIIKVFYPVDTPERNADDVLRWLGGEA